MPTEVINPQEIPDEIQKEMQLEDIFMPHSRSKREAAYRADSPTVGVGGYARFVHYTSAEAALNIIKSKCIWMRNSSCMSDYREVEHGISILRNRFSDRENCTSKLFDALHECAPDALSEAIELFEKRLGAIKAGTYILSISEHNSCEDSHGRLSMWRTYCGDKGRVAIVFKIPKYTDNITKAVRALKINFSPVIYTLEDGFQNEIDNIICNIKENNEFLKSVGKDMIVSQIYKLLVNSATCLKHPGFIEEQEWRVMHFPILSSSDLMLFETISYNGVPQKIIKLPLDSKIDNSLKELDLAHIFDRLIIGPTAYEWPMYQAFCDVLTDVGVEKSHEKVFISQIPIRT